MISYENCDLYKLNRKRDLFKILGMKKDEIKSVINCYTACVEVDEITQKKRLLEKPSYQLKKIQKVLLGKLSQIDFPSNIFSGVKGKSAYDNAFAHVNAEYMLKLDMSKFFPNTHRNNVYDFYRNKLKMAPDVAELCTNITTVNYDEDNITIDDGVIEYLKSNQIKNRNHLPSGTPTSQLLSYLSNQELFDEINDYCRKHKLTCTIYVDDITISTDKKISNVEERELKAIIRRNGHRISKNKTVRYEKHEYKKVTGYVISPSRRFVVANKIRRKIKALAPKGKEIKDTSKATLIGLINFSQISKVDAYRGLKRNLEEKNNTYNIL